MSVEEGSSDYKLASRRGGGKTQRKKSKQDSSNRVEGKYYVLYVCMYVCIYVSCVFVPMSLFSFHVLYVCRILS